ncbi:MAG: hypothetical protein NZT61_05840 [Deltaproteobacteria bacterium]|nr:hypothetical protein [Deltaproteobacteria bacterium]MCX7953181.1 hypothetical protein [Deltaproteobacteria bacterium]
MRYFFGLVATFFLGCDDSFFFSWDGKWQLDTEKASFDFGECQNDCLDAVSRVPVFFHVDVDYSSIFEDYVFCRIDCGKECRNISGGLDGRFNRVDERSVLNLSGNVKFQSSKCNLLISNARLILGKSSSKRISVELTGSGRNSLTKKRCNVTIFGEARRR